MTGRAEAFARLVSERVPPAKAREAVEAADDILEWRYGYVDPYRLLRLAKLIIEHERIEHERQARPQFELFR